MTYLFQKFRNDMFLNGLHGSSMICFLKLGIEDGYCKFYDPLLIEDDKCHSYVFDLGDDGRHHPYKNLREIEDRLFNEVVKRIKKESVH